MDSYAYDPWGEEIGSSGTAYNPYRYTGTYLDSATGLYQMGARYHQPGAGRFTQQDPLPCSVRQGQRYACAGNSPVNFIDPAGTNHYPNHWCHWEYNRKLEKVQVGTYRGDRWYACLVTCHTVTNGASVIPAFKAFSVLRALGIVTTMSIARWSCDQVCDRWFRSPR